MPFFIVLHVRYNNIYLQCLFLDNYILEIFNKESGLLQFIKEVLCNKIYEKSKLKSFELLHTLVNNCHGKIEKYFPYILFTCVPIIFSSYASSDEKSKVITLVVLILDRGRNCIDDETVVKIYDQLFRCMCSSFVKTPTGTCILFMMSIPIPQHKKTSKITFHQIAHSLICSQSAIFSRYVVHSGSSAYNIHIGEIQRLILNFYVYYD